MDTKHRGRGHIVSRVQKSILFLLYTFYPTVTLSLYLYTASSATLRHICFVRVFLSTRYALLKFLRCELKGKLLRNNLLAIASRGDAIVLPSSFRVGLDKVLFLSIACCGDGSAYAIRIFGLCIFHLYKFNIPLYSEIAIPIHFNITYLIINFYPAFLVQLNYIRVHVIGYANTLNWMNIIEPPEISIESKRGDDALRILCKLRIIEVTFRVHYIHKA